MIANENQSPTPTLMTMLNFTDDDLDANRAGRLSEMQDYRLRVRRQRAVLSGIGILLIAAFVASLLIFQGRKTDNAILTIIGFGLTACDAVLGTIFARHWVRLTMDIRSGQVSAVSGQLERIIKPITRRVLLYLIRVGDVEVQVSKETITAFEHKADYTLYRTSYTGALLSAENHNQKS